MGIKIRLKTDVYNDINRLRNRVEGMSIVNLVLLILTLFTEEFKIRMIFVGIGVLMNLLVIVSKLVWDMEKEDKGKDKNKKEELKWK